MKIQFVAAVGIISLLGACGGGSTGSNIPSFASLDDALAEAGAAQGRVAGLSLTALDDIPTTGTATYEGVLAISDEDGTDAADASVTGGMTMTLDFANAANSSGSAGNFFDEAGTEVGGTLTLDDFAFFQGSGGGSVGAELTGRLTDVGRAGTDANYDYDLQAGGIYQGDDVQAITFLMPGTVSEVGSAEERQATGAGNLERQ